MKPSEKIEEIRKRMEMVHADKCRDHGYACYRDFHREALIEYMDEEQQKIERCHGTCNHSSDCQLGD